MRTHERHHEHADDWHDRTDDDFATGAVKQDDDLGAILDDALKMATAGMRFALDAARQAMREALRDVPQAQRFMHGGRSRGHDRWTRHYADDGR